MYEYVWNVYVTINVCVQKKNCNCVDLVKVLSLAAVMEGSTVVAQMIGAFSQPINAMQNQDAYWSLNLKNFASINFGINKHKKDKKTNLNALQEQEISQLSYGL